MLYTILRALVAHVLGDYVLQRLLYRLLPKKQQSRWGMLVHSVYAEALCGLAIGIATHHALASVVAAVLAHYVVDTTMPVRKGRLQSLIDQAMHALCVAAIYTLMEVC